MSEAQNSGNSQAAPGERRIATLRHNGTVPPSGPLRLHGDIAQNWREWRQLWDSYSIVAHLDEKNYENRIAMHICHESWTGSPQDVQRIAF